MVRAYKLKHIYTYTGCINIKRATRAMTTEMNIVYQKYSSVLCTFVCNDKQQPSNELRTPKKKTIFRNSTFRQCEKHFLESALDWFFFYVECIQFIDTKHTKDAVKGVRECLSKYCISLLYQSSCQHNI